MISDFILTAIRLMASAAAELLPRLPSSVIRPLETSLTALRSLDLQIPYGGVLPLAQVSVLAMIFPIALGTVLSIRLVVRVSAWVRSRGTSSA